MPRYVGPLTAALVAAAALGACSEAGPAGDASPSSSAADPSASSTPSPTGSPAAAPADWRPAAAGTEESVTTNGEWTLTVAADRASATLEGPGGVHGFQERDRQVSDALLSDTHAVVVLQDRHESRPAVATVVDLASGRQRVLDDTSGVPTTTGGTWALGEDRLVHATVGPGRAYCLASVDLATGAGAIEWCAEERHGFNGAQLTPAGLTLMTFDDARPSCRTVVTVADGRTAPIPGATACRGWDAALLDSGPVWSEVTNESRVEAGVFRARTDDGVVDLGPGTSGTLVACVGSAYFVRDSEGGREPARLMRWDGHELTVAYESPRGPAFLERPRCGGAALTVSAFAEGGDEQVTAAL